MSRVPKAPVRLAPVAVLQSRPAPTLRPTWLDYLLILAGCALSLFLSELSGLQAVRGEEVLSSVGEPPLAVLPRLLWLPLGMILLWPVFYTTQRVRGRTQGLTVGEWLWGVAWLLAVALTTWVFWQYGRKPDELLVSASFKWYVVTGYNLAVLSLGVIALLLLLIDLVGRWDQPWTHRFGLVLLLWPALPLAALIACGIQVAFPSPPTVP